MSYKSFKKLDAELCTKIACSTKSNGEILTPLDAIKKSGGLSKEDTRKFKNGLKEYAKQYANNVAKSVVLYIDDNAMERYKLKHSYLDDVDPTDMSEIDIFIAIEIANYNINYLEKHCSAVPDSVLKDIREREDKLMQLIHLTANYKVNFERSLRGDMRIISKDDYLNEFKVWYAFWKTWLLDKYGNRNYIKTLKRIQRKKLVLDEPPDNWGDKCIDLIDKYKNIEEEPESQTNNENTRGGWTLFDMKGNPYPVRNHTVQPKHQNKYKKVRTYHKLDPRIVERGGEDPIGEFFKGVVSDSEMYVTENFNTRGRKQKKRPKSKPKPTKAIGKERDMSINSVINRNKNE
ncbi:MAG: hypothetical protein WC783_00485 [Candidatus Paceibacterota bacterium]|jgi:hypothetical protein